MVGTQEHNAETVAFLGPPGSFTHQATLTRFADPSHSLTSQTTIADVFRAVSSGAVSRGVVPLQNSTNGAVVATLDLLLDRTGQHRNIRVCDEIILTVHHCLLGHAVNGAGAEAHDAGALASEARFAHIRHLYSHPQAWGQCETFLQRHLPGVSRQDVSSTSEAAERVRRDAAERARGEPATAAISSRAVARLTGLDVLAENIEDVEGNSTRFLVLTAAVPRRTELQADQEWRSLFAFSTPHDRPQALGAYLAALGSRCRSLHSRPSGKQPWHDAYLCETTGEWGGDEDLAASIIAIDPTLREVTLEWRWLGSWSRDCLRVTSTTET